MKHTKEGFVDLKGLPPMRCDRYVSELWGIHSRSQLHALNVDVCVDNKPVKWGYKVFNGQRIEISWQHIQQEFLPEDLPLDILWEDKDVWVINKPQGLVVHPGAGQHTGTLANALAFRLGHCATESNNSTRTGIVHRLDKDTSGVIICAKNAHTHDFLSSQFQNRSTKKRYLALCANTQGHPYHGEIRNYIFRSSHDRKKFSCGTEPSRGRHALTKYSILKNRNHFGLVLFKPHTGRTHQLRVHAKALGFPILGDPIYFPHSTHDGTMLMLHAWKLRIQLPSENTPRVFVAPPPPRFYDYWDKIHE
ncbi:MAG: RluA family pseudouridine synthase [Spirochaetia bacterium]